MNDYEFPEYTPRAIGLEIRFNDNFLVNLKYQKVFFSN